MHCLSLPIPVARLLKRLFNVVSTLTISNQYIIAQKAEIDSVRDSPTRWKAPELEKVPVRDLLAARFTDVGNSFSSGMLEGICIQNVDLYLSIGADELLLRWHKLRTTSSLRLPYGSRHAHSISAQDSHSYDSDLEYVIEESSQPTSSSPPSSSPDQKPVKRSPSGQHADTTASISPIQQLLLSPVLYDPIRKPRHPIVLCHGELVHEVIR